MKKLFWFLLIVIPVLFFNSCKKDDGFFTSPKTGDLLIDTIINVSRNEAVVSIPEGLTVTVPAGLSSSPFSLKIHEVDVSAEVPAVMNLLSAFDIELSIGEVFEKELTLRIDFDPFLISGEKSAGDFAFGYYNVYDQKWAVFPDYEVNISQGYTECRTSHLTTVGFWEFLTTGGYAHKFFGDNVTVYYSLSNGSAPMDYSDYMPSGQPWHLPSGSENWAPLYIQDIAHYIADARKLFAKSPHKLNVSKGNINVYVNDMDVSDGEYGTISGAIYIKNTMDLPNNVPGISYQDVLKATCAHELMHYIQDNYYVMNKGSIGMWWLEATATQADRMAWGSSLPYSESEIYSIEANATLLENLGKPWDDCNNDPNWYLSGCFLQYMSTYRPGAKLNVADVVKTGGSSMLLVRMMLHDEIKKQLGSAISDEYRDYVLYLFTGGNEKLSAIPASKDINEIITASSLTEQVKMSKSNNTQSLTVSLPYLSSKLIYVSNMENTNMRYSYNYLESSPFVDAYLFDADGITGDFKMVDFLYEGKTGDVDTEGRVASATDGFFILLVNSSFTEGDEEVKFIFQTAPDFQDFDFMEFSLEGETGNFEYSNGYIDNIWKIGFIKFSKDVDYGDIQFRVVSKSFAGNKIDLTVEKTASMLGFDSYSYLNNYVQTVNITGEYDAGGFVVLNLEEHVTGEIEEWSDDKGGWVKHTVVSEKELEYTSIPFIVINSDYGQVYGYSELNNSEIKSRLKNISHVVTEYDDEGEVYRHYSLMPIDWGSLPSWFKAVMITTK